MHLTDRPTLREYYRAGKRYHVTISDPAGWSKLWNKSPRAWHQAVRREREIRNAVRNVSPQTTLSLIVTEVDPRTSVAWLAGDAHDSLPWHKITLQRALVGEHQPQPSISM